MGIEVVKIPPDWHHPVDEAGNFVIGAHREPRYAWDPNSRRAFQRYENVTEDSPISPVLDETHESRTWMTWNCGSEEAVEVLLSNGHAPSFIIRQPERPVINFRIEVARRLTPGCFRDAPLAFGATDRD
jgi:hypothetical protein